MMNNKCAGWYRKLITVETRNMREKPSFQTPHKQHTSSPVTVLENLFGVLITSAQLQHNDTRIFFFRCGHFPKDMCTTLRNFAQKATFQQMGISNNNAQICNVQNLSPLQSKIIDTKKGTLCGPKCNGGV